MEILFIFIVKNKIYPKNWLLLLKSTFNIENLYWNYFSCHIFILISWNFLCLLFIVFMNFRKINSKLETISIMIKTIWEFIVPVKKDICFLEMVHKAILSKMNFLVLIHFLNDLSLVFRPLRCFNWMSNHFWQCLWFLRNTSYYFFFWNHVLFGYFLNVTNSFFILQSKKLII